MMTPEQIIAWLNLEGYHLCYCSHDSVAVRIVHEMTRASEPRGVWDTEKGWVVSNISMWPFARYYPTSLSSIPAYMRDELTIEFAQQLVEAYRVYVS